MPDGTRQPLGWFRGLFPFYCRKCGVKITKYQAETNYTSVNGWTTWNVCSPCGDKYENVTVKPRWTADMRLETDEIEIKGKQDAD